MAIDLSALNNNPEPAVGPVCGRCGKTMPPLSEELAALARAAGGVQLTHEVCPGEQPTGPVGRYFEVRVDVVEVIEHDEGDGDTGEREITTEELVSFRAGVRAADLDSAMRPLALALGEKWTLAEKQAKIADQPL